MSKNKYLKGLRKRPQHPKRELNNDWISVVKDRSFHDIEREQLESELNEVKQSKNRSDSYKHRIPTVQESMDFSKDYTQKITEVSELSKDYTKKISKSGNYRELNSEIDVIDTDENPEKESNDVAVKSEADKKSIEKNEENSDSNKSISSDKSHDDDSTEESDDENKNSKDGTPKEFFLEIVDQLKNADLKGRGSMMAYSLLMASIPLILVFIQLASLVINDPQFAFRDLAQQLPDGTGDLVIGVVETLADNASGAAISITVLSTIWLGSNGINTLLVSINESYGFKSKRNVIVTRILAFVYTILFLIVLIATLLLIVFYDSIHMIIGQVLQIEHLFGDLWSIAESFIIRILPIALFIFVMILFYKTAPLATGGKISWREASVGGLFATVSIVAITLLYTFFMNNISNMSIYYGSLAAVLALLAWLLYICQILLAGAEIVAAFRNTFGTNVSKS